MSVSPIITVSVLQRKGMDDWEAPAICSIWALFPHDCPLERRPLLLSPIGHLAHILLLQKRVLRPKIHSWPGTSWGWIGLSTDGPHPLLKAAPFSSGCKKSMGSCSHGSLGLTWPYYLLALDLKHIVHPLRVTFPPFIKHGLSQTVQGYYEDDMKQASQGLACQRCPMLSAFALHCKCSCK